MAIPVAAAIPLIKEVITGITSYLATKEQAKTERQRIAAELEAKLTAINMRYNSIDKGLQYNHEEVMQYYNLIEELIKAPYIKENPDLLKAALNSLVGFNNGQVKKIETIFFGTGDSHDKALGGNDGVDGWLTN